MNYEIISTLGPAADQPHFWPAMLSAGATAFRLNTSHLTLAQTLDWLLKLQGVFPDVAHMPPVVLDLQGSKWRLGNISPLTLSAGEKVQLVCASSTSQPGTLPVPHADFFQAAANSSGEIILNDAKVRLQLEHIAGETIRAAVTQGGPLSANKGITLTESSYRREGLNQKDQAILEQTRDFPFIRYAISYIRDAAEMAAYRAHLGPQPYLIAKLEREQAIAEAAAMTRDTNELWVCRGDLGAELGLKALAESVSHFNVLVPDIPVPVIMAGQVLEYMTRQPTPTRSEVCYLYDTLQHGYAGVVLSDETAVGKYPLESIRTAALFKS